MQSKLDLNQNGNHVTVTGELSELIRIGNLVHNGQLIITGNGNGQETTVLAVVHGGSKWWEDAVHVSKRNRRESKVVDMPTPYLANAIAVDARELRLALDGDDVMELLSDEDTRNMLMELISRIEEENN